MKLCEHQTIGKEKSELAFPRGDSRYPNAILNAFLSNITIREKITCAISTQRGDTQGQSLHLLSDYLNFGITV